MKEELMELRQKMKEYGMAAYLIVSDDFHASEYVGEYFKCREYISGFNGSAGTLVITGDMAGLWTDGRYFIQAEEQLAGTGIMLFRSGQPGVVDIGTFLAEKMEDGTVLGFDGRTVSTGMAKSLKEKLREKKITFAPDRDVVGEIWVNRPALSCDPIWELGVEYAGESRKDKVAGVRKAMVDCKADYFLIPSLDEIAWLFNIRGNDIAYNPVALSYVLIAPDEIRWYVNEKSVPADLKERLSAEKIFIYRYEQIYADIKEIPADKSILIDESMTNYALYDAIPKDIYMIKKNSPIELMKAVKNATEMEHERLAHKKDGIALTKLIYWLKHVEDKRQITELTVCDKLEEFRRQGEGYLGQSFAPIAAYGAHGAIVHYEPDEKSNIPLDNKSFLLLDTGGQYLDGTTDVTRTIALGTLSTEEKKHYTAVLRGNLKLSDAKFKYGCTGVNLDYLAREALWHMGLDYNHGTGHGVGYLLNVHEGPNAFRYRERCGTGTVMEEGMITSDEPGLYLEGKYGIRLENLLLCKKAEKTEYGQFMEFETLTVAPFDLEAIDWEELDSREKALLQKYQQYVYDTIADFLSEEEKTWLKEQIPA